MKTFYRFLIVLVAVVTTALAAGCATVDLGPDYNAPQVRMPGGASTTTPARSSVTAPPAPPPPTTAPVRTMPVTSSTLSPDESVVDDSADTDDATGGEAVSAMPAPDAPGAGIHLVTLTARADGADAVPPTPSPGTAQVDLIYDADTNLLRWKTVWTDLSAPITAVRFHGPAAQGQQGPATLIWPGPFGPSYEGRATLTAEQATDLVGGLWYVNIYTANYPTGEIRGQLRVVY